MNNLRTAKLVQKAFKRDQKESERKQERQRKWMTWQFSAVLDVLLTAAQGELGVQMKENQYTSMHIPYCTHATHDKHQNWLILSSKQSTGVNSTDSSTDFFICIYYIKIHTVQEFEVGKIFMTTKAAFMSLKKLLKIYNNNNNK